MSDLAYFPDLAAELDRLTPANETATPDWPDVRMRLGATPSPYSRAGRIGHVLRRRSRRRLVVAVVVMTLLLAGIATGTYLALSGDDSPTAGGEITLIGLQPGGRHGQVDRIAAVGPDGRLHTVWRCPRNDWCGDLASIAWSRDGRKLAFTLDELAGHSQLVGLHILDAATGRDVQIPRPPARGSLKQREDLLDKRIWARFGCFVPLGLDWSPDGSRLAYNCIGSVINAGTSRIRVINSDGTGRATMVDTGPGEAFWPSWSPDGKRLAYATWTAPVERVVNAVQDSPTAPTRTHLVRSSVYVVDLTSGKRTLVAHNASAPAWSPDGATIAYWGSCGLRLATPSGHDVTPRRGSAHCRAIGPAGPPSWSPDGTSVAVRAARTQSRGSVGHSADIYVVTPDGRSVKRVASGVDTTLFWPARPAWQPVIGSSPVRPDNADSTCAGCY